MLGVGFDELKRRESRRQLHQRLQMAAAGLAIVAVIGGVWWNRQHALEGQRQIALAQRLVDQSTELLDSEQPETIQSGVLLILQALTRLERQAPDVAENGEAAQARLAADQNLRRALSLLYTPHVVLSAAPVAKVYADRGWQSWTAEAVAFGADGQTVTAASGWGSTPMAAVARWRLADGQEDTRLRISLPDARFDWPTPTDRANPRYFALSPDGAYLATVESASFGQPGTVRLYRLPEGRQIGQLEYTGEINGIALGPRGAFVAVSVMSRTSEPLPLRLWHVASGRGVAGIADTTSIANPRAFAFSPDGRYLAIAGARVSVWELPKGEDQLLARQRIRLDLYRGEAVAFSPDGRYLVAGGTEATSWSGGEPFTFGRRLVRVWELTESREIATLPPPETLNGLALGRGAKYLAIVDEEHSLMLHALASGRARRVHFSPSDPSRSIGSRSRVMNLSGKGPGARGRLAAVAFSAHDDLMAMAGETDAVVWRLSSFDEQLLLDVDNEVVDVAFDAHERAVIVVHRAADSRALVVRAWEVESGRDLPERRAEHAADAFALTRTGELLRAVDEARGSGRGGTLVIDGGRVGPFRYEGDVKRIFVTQDQQYVAVASALGEAAPKPVSPGRHRVTVWDLRSGTEALRFDYETAERNNGPDAFFILGGRWYFGVYDVTTLDGGGTQSTYVLWDMKTRERRPERTDEISELLRSDLARSADGRWYGLERDDAVHVLTAAPAREVARIPVALAGKESSPLSSMRVAVGASGRYVAAVTADRTVRVWPVDPALLVSLACSRLTRDLSPDEWDAYLPTEPSEPVCPH
jgi:WD40 repeat protein